MIDNNKIYYEHNKYYIQNGGVYVAFNTIREVREYLANRLKNI